jgi:23S rRNA (adenine2503-C2)-methyltransferase
MQEETKPLVYDLTLDELTALLARWGEPAFRAQQIWQGIYQQLWLYPDEFTNISLGLRQKLAEELRWNAIVPAVVQQSNDQETVKTLFRLHDEREIEAVLMRYDDRRTLCISSQSGCAMGCVFCATGQMGFKRHLSAGEIISQVLYYARQLKDQGEHVTNVVLMGMGEPFHNYENTMEAIDRLNDPLGFNLGARRFTISTVGLVPMIRKFAKEKRQVNLAISLHAATDEKRSALLPVNRRYPIKEVIDACREYVDITGRRVTFEWALIRDENDTPEHARELANLLKGLLCHVNVIPLNPTEMYAGQATTRERAKAFCDILNKAGISCTIRIRRGIDIQAGCGQLASSEQRKRGLSGEAQPLDPAARETAISAPQADQQAQPRAARQPSRRAAPRTTSETEHEAPSGTGASYGGANKGSTKPGRPKSSGARPGTTRSGGTRGSGARPVGPKAGAKRPASKSGRTKPGGPKPGSGRNSPGGRRRSPNSGGRSGGRNRQ